jgi:hypothetical protein
MPSGALDLLRQWLLRVLPTEAGQWLEAEINRYRDSVEERRLGIALGLVGRRIGRAEMMLRAEDIVAARSLQQGWQPEFWSTDEATRAALLLATWKNNDDAFVARIERLCTSGELNEQTACLKGFAIFPAARRLLGCARDAMRSSVQPQFEAIACRNPYPAAYFDTAAFNQMVVKCVFSGLSIETVVGLSQRRNGELVRMMRDLVSERHAAGRPVPDAVLRWIADTGATREFSH